MTNAIKLLYEVKTKLDEEKKLKQRTGEDFNLLEITEINTSERAVCKILYELLSPYGRHHQGTFFLKLFFEYVLQQPYDEQDNSIEIYSEYTITNGKRIDLVIKSNTFFIPIEAKIYAADQDWQCFDYYNEAKNFYDAHPNTQYLPCVYYLTLYGSTPSPNSANGLESSDDISSAAPIKRISFSNHILNWLKACLADLTLMQIGPIRENIIQLIRAIEHITNTPNNSLLNQIIKTLQSTPENYRSILLIKQAVFEAKKQIVSNIFNAIEEQAKNKANLTKIAGQNDYSQETNNFPGISFLCKTASELHKESDLHVRIEYDFKSFYIGYVSYNQDPNAPFDWTPDECSTILNTTFTRWYNFIHWEYLPIKNNQIMLNDYLFADLLDQTTLMTFADLCVQKISEFIKKVQL